jgi:hypothetical protein
MGRLDDLARAAVAPQAPAREPQPAAVVEPKPDKELSNRRPATFHIDQDLTEAVRDAVIHLMGAPAYMTLSELVEVALTRELERLSKAFNNGEAFPAAPPKAKIKIGRPMRRK